MAKGISLHIGVNLSQATGGIYLWPPLRTCVNSAQKMAEIAESRHFKAEFLPNEKATRLAIIQSIKRAASTLIGGDIFFVSFSGHGTQVKDENGDESLTLGGDGLDETWCCFDGKIIDDELATLWAEFRPGVRILAISDSCHSGTVTRSARRPGRVPIGAKGLLIGACRDAETVMADDGSGFSPFTHALVETWQKIVATHSKADYREFYSRIHRMLQGRQTPSWYRFGTIDDDFYLEPPFSIEHTIALRRTRGAPSNKIGHQD